jgi:hypothetical protein
MKTDGYGVLLVGAAWTDGCQLDVNEGRLSI